MKQPPTAGMQRGPKNRVGHFLVGLTDTQNAIPSGAINMTKADALTAFHEKVFPLAVKTYGKDDRPTIREAWNDYTDVLIQNGQITLVEYETWVGPFL